MNKTTYLIPLAAIGLLQSCIFVVHADGDDFRPGGHGNVVQGSGVEARDERSLAPFRRIAVEDSIDLEVRQGDTQSVIVRADDNFLSWIHTTVEEGVLKVRWVAPEHSGSSTSLGPRVEVVVPVLDAVSVSGMGDTRLSGLAGPALSIDASGSGDVRAEGRIERLTVSLSGSGDVSLFGIDARDVNVSLSGSGNVDVSASETLRVSVAGSGDVRYRGRPKDVTRSVAGSGRVEPDGK